MTGVKRCVDLDQIMPQYIPPLKLNLVPLCGFVDLLCFETMEYGIETLSIFKVNTH